MTEGEKPSRRKAGIFRTIDARVRKAHANWIAIWALIAGTVAALVIAIYFAPQGGTSSFTSPLPSEGAGQGATSTTGSDREPPPIIYAKNREPEESDRACDQSYAEAKKREFLTLIEAEARRRRQTVGGHTDLAYTCRVRAGVYEVTLQTAITQAAGGEAHPFSAQYRGAKDIDPGQVNVGPLTP